MSDSFLQNCSLWGLLLQAADEKESGNGVDKIMPFLKEFQLSDPGVVKRKSYRSIIAE